jgi:NAD(P)-dependent dehydrogenase (short-subunit alcohol dehydrogenase family)
LIPRASRKSRDGRTAFYEIITITSANAKVVGLNRADYCMTKAALSMMSKLFAARLASANVHVFELRPGIIRTEMTRPAVAKYDALSRTEASRWPAGDCPRMSEPPWRRSLAAVFPSPRAR